MASDKDGKRAISPETSAEYLPEFQDIFSRIQEAKRKAHFQINSTVMDLYWAIGRHIDRQLENSNWGQGVVTELSRYIRQQDVELKGYAPRNLWRMRQFYQTWRDQPKLSTLWTQLSWSHNRRIMTLKTLQEREFYLTLCAEKGYSFRELERLIQSGTFERTMLGEGNLSETVRQLPQDTDGVFKDSYVFEFLNLPVPHREKDLQQALVASLKDFILELGAGFSFIGQEYRLQVGMDDFFIDLLFYHRHLQCLVAVELKTVKFDPSHLGKLEFYLETLDRNVRLEHENPSIGVLLCREKNDEVVRYSLARSVSPAVIADYETKLIPKDLLRRKLNEFYLLLERQNEE